MKSWHYMKSSAMRENNHQSYTFWLRVVNLIAYHASNMFEEKDLVQNIYLNRLLYHKARFPYLTKGYSVRAK